MQVPVHQHRHLGVVILFVLVPAVTGLILVDRRLGWAIEERRNAGFEALERDARSLARAIDPERVYFDQLRAFAADVLARSPTPARLAAAWQRHQARGGLPFDPYLFDPTGRLLPVEGLTVQASATIQKIWDIAWQTPGFRPGDYNIFKGPIRSLFGPQLSIHGLPAREGEIIRVRCDHVQRMLYWRGQRRGGFSGLLTVVWQLPEPAKLLRRVLARRPRRPLAVMVRHRGDRVTGHWLGRDPIPWPPGFASGSVLLPPQLEHGNWWWVRTQIGNLPLLVGRPATLASLHRWRQAVTGAALLLLLLGGWYAARGDWQELWRGLPLRHRLVSLFAFTVSLPLLGMAILSARTLRDREQVLTGEALRAGKEALDHLDLGIHRERRRFLALCRNLRDDPLARANHAAMQEKVRDLGNREELNWFEGRRPDGQIAFTSESPAVTQRIGPVAAVTSRIIIERWLGDRLGPSTRERLPDQTELMVRSVVESPLLGFAQILDRPDRIHAVRFGGYDLYWYWDYYRDPTHPLALVEGDQVLDQAVRKYLAHALTSRRTHGFGAFRVLAHDIIGGNWLPAGLVPNAALRQLVDRAVIAGQLVTDQVNWRQERWLAMAVPGKHLAGHLLLALYPVAALTGPIDRMAHDIWLGILVAGLIAVVLGLALAETFVVPLGELGQAIGALRQRDTEVRLPVRQRDELGDLAHLFNQMVDGVKEMLVARSVQECLIPRQAPDTPGYEIELVNLPATDLGGDYVDATVLPDGRRLLIMGDVTGHGVSSALITAMAKAVVFRFATQPTALTVLMDRLNQVITRLVRKHKRMTLGAAILDPVRHSLEVSNAGHLFPLRVAPDGTLTDLEVIHPPLGFTTREGTFESIAVELAPGESVIQYTDGLIEAMNPAGEMFDQTRLHALASAMARRPPRDLVRALLEAWVTHRAGGEPDDDLSLLVLRRDPESEAPLPLVSTPCTTGGKTSLHS